MDALPKLDRDAYREQMRAEFERALTEVADAIDEAPKGRVIRDSEERARDALDRFRQKGHAVENRSGGSRFSPLRTIRRRSVATAIKAVSPTRC